MDDKVKFGLYLAKLREKQGFDSQRKLALAAKVSPATISRIEAGIQKAEPDTLKKLAPYLGVPLEVLMEKAGYLDSVVINDPPTLDDELNAIMRNLGPDVTLQFYDLKGMTEEEKEQLKIFLQGLKARREQQKEKRE
ncbi:Helix-turn-helix [Thermosyntropha lipolytica DSM 11003]|uniref:Helix-turn-helix n=1 Tax=Thermosyntropha lipolytica DSM 11003 TaxID=1123382 RepID=A0A1M5S0L5_9FIRM|nr:helix-turn-helix transcriptional regulator [Thermosyntropha lipolytica]SHH32030.1 Helix-turn-helix [Thermosyntropha lipolytica DSM 11003]